MSFVMVTPDLLTAAATDLENIGSAISQAGTAAAAPTTALLAAAADEISEQIAALFGAHGQAFQTASAQAAALHGRFVQTPARYLGAYASAEAAAASALQPFLDVINAPTQALVGRPLIGNGANSAPGTGAHGGDGGILIGTGGNGGAGAGLGVAPLPGGSGGNGGDAQLSAPAATAAIAGWAPLRVGWRWRRRRATARPERHQRVVTWPAPPSAATGARRRPQRHLG